MIRDARLSWRICRHVRLIEKRERPLIKIPLPVISRAYLFAPRRGALSEAGTVKLLSRIYRALRPTLRAAKDVARKVRESPRMYISHRQTGARKHRAARRSLHIRSNNRKITPRI